jgi:hypothetical protein
MERANTRCALPLDRSTPAGVRARALRPPVGAHRDAQPAGDEWDERPLPYDGEENSDEDQLVDVVCAWCVASTAKAARRIGTEPLSPLQVMNSRWRE